MRAEGLVIHLARAAGRQAQAASIAAALPLPARILDAVDGQALDNCTTAYCPRLARPRYPFGLSNTEIACFLSHRAAWRTIIDEELDFGLIVEDDVVVDDPRLAGAVRWALPLLGARDYLRLPVKAKREHGPTRHSSGGIRIIEPELPGLGMQMQIVGREAAASLLAASGTFDRPVDSFVQMQWLHEARVLSLHPALITEISAALGGTVVQNKHMAVLEKLSHEIRRPLLRAAIARANARWRATTGWKAAP